MTAKQQMHFLIHCWRKLFTYFISKQFFWDNICTSSHLRTTLSLTDNFRPSTDHFYLLTSYFRPLTDQLWSLSYHEKLTTCCQLSVTDHFLPLIDHFRSLIVHFWSLTDGNSLTTDSHLLTTDS